jgi:hypothetical protein
VATITINRETGTLQIGHYTIHPRSTYGEMGDNYPELKRHLVHSDEAYVYLPQLEFLNDDIETRLDFFSRYISGVYISRPIEKGTEATWVKNLHEMVIWTQHIKSWLSREFGSPHREEPPVLLDEDDWLSKDEVAHLDYWIYEFPWGEFGYTFHWETNASIHFRYDIPYQMQDWDGLREECRYLKVNRYPNVDVLTNNHLIQEAIDVLSTNYDYKVIRPIVHVNGLIFDLPQWSTKAIVEVRPNYPDAPYRISRNDTLKTVYVTKENLVESLQTFLTIEKL